jgi:hypothetical protein
MPYWGSYRLIVDLTSKPTAARVKFGGEESPKFLRINPKSSFG